MHRISLGAVLAAALAATLSSAPTPADEVRPGGAPGRIRIHGPEEVLRDYCATDVEGRLWLKLPGGPRFELVTSTSDPAVPNPGDGSFHRFDVSEIEAAIRAVRFPLGSIRAEVLVLPFPRRLGLESAAGPGLILLSPGVRPIPAEQQHAEFVHELGHVVQYALMPDGDVARWETYRRLRGIEDQSRYSAGSIHADRPHEIFAEDFRALFGGPLATYSGTIENPSLEPPGQVPGLARFMLELVPDAASVREGLVASPNPVRNAVGFSRPGGRGAPLDVFDAAGRRLATLDPREAGGTVEWAWDARDERGRTVPPGVVFARERGTSRPAVRVILVP